MPTAAHLAVIPFLLLGTIAGVSGPACAQNSGAIRHTPPARADEWQPLGIEAVVTGELSTEEAVAADAVVLTGDGAAHVVPLIISRSAVFGEIPGALVTRPELSYYLQVTLPDGDVISSPPGAPGDVFIVRVVSYQDQPAPEGIVSTQTSAGSDPEELWISPSVDILSPLPGETTESARPSIATVFDPPLSEPWDALVLLDGEDMTEASTISSDLFILTPEDTLARGIHRATFSAMTAVGTVEASWIFFVLDREESGLEIQPGGVEGYSGRVARPGDGSGSAFASEGDGWYVSGRLEAGWAIVEAETTDVDTADVFLPYSEIDGLMGDLYFSAIRGDFALLFTARRDPVFSDDLEWLVSAGAPNYEFEAGEIFPSLSEYTLDWAVGHGARASARIGRSATDFVGMRISKADTLEGFGIYSRFAAGGMQTFDWTDHLSTSLVYLSIFDREASISEEQRLTDPLENEVVSGLVKVQLGQVAAEAELARSRASGETEGRGTAFRAVLKREWDWDNRVSLEYSATEPGFYSAGSYLRVPGEHVLQVDYACRPTERLSSSGWVSAGRSFDSDSALAEDAIELKLYGRVEMTWPDLGDDARTYAIVRYDVTPYESYDYSYAYALVGGTWRRHETRLSGSTSLSRAESMYRTDTWSFSGSLKQELLQDRWSAGAAVTWTTGSGSEIVDYGRLRVSVDTRLDLGPADITAEYWLLDRDDRADALQSYTEHVFKIALGRNI
jgi:hypothetical protein